MLRIIASNALLQIKDKKEVGNSTPPILLSAMAPIHYSQILLCSLSVLWFLIPESKALSVNLTNIVDQHQDVNITTSGTAFISSSKPKVLLQVTNDGINDTTGKATYLELLHLWDKSTANITDFSTHFTFVIDSVGQYAFGDGMTFFLAPNGSTTSMSGGSMGLPFDLKKFSPTSSFVAVEFDTYWNNQWDPVNMNPANITPGTHVGINVNSLRSNVTVVWYSNITYGIENEAWINYDSTSHNLSVVFTGSDNMTTRVLDSIYLIIDLREYLPEWVTFGFSASTGSASEDTVVTSWEFSSRLKIDETDDNVTNHVKPRSTKISLRLVVGLVVGSGVLVGGFVSGGFYLWKRSKEKEEDEFEVEMTMQEEFESGVGPKKFSYSQLSQATNNFKEGQKLGEGGFGGVYRGFFSESNSCVAVKKISKGSKQGIKEYATEVKIISRLRHRNLLQLIGWCHEKKELLLVYEFMENGSLDFHLFKGKSLLTWGTRYKIAQDLASALLYLHEEWEQCVVHRDIKSSNVMLDSCFNAKLGDFGLARFVDHAKGSRTTILAGTLGYLAPESMVTGKASKESDVYSFGVVSLEISCGIRPFDMKLLECEMGMVEWVWNLYGMGKLLEAVDPKLGTNFDERELERLMIVGLWCAHPDHNLRPNIRQAIQVLSFQAPLPILPQKQPALSFNPPPVLNTTTTTISSGWLSSLPR